MVAIGLSMTTASPGSMPRQTGGRGNDGGVENPPSDAITDDADLVGARHRLPPVR